MKTPPSRAYGVLSKLKNYTTQFVVKVVYNSLIHPYLNYSIHSWGLASNAIIQPLINLRNKAIKLISPTNDIYNVLYVIGPTKHGRILLFGALGYFNWGSLEGLRLPMSYKSEVHVLTAFTEQVVPIHKHITLFWIPSISGTRAVSASPAVRTQEDPNFREYPPNKI